MKALKYFPKWLRLLTTHFLVGTICLHTKFGIGKQLCREFKASMVLGGGVGAYFKGNYKKAYEILSPYKDVKDDFAFRGIKYQLALLFYYGLGVT
jgi:hypothetical protein